MYAYMSGNAGVYKMCAACRRHFKRLRYKVEGITSILTIFDRIMKDKERKWGKLTTGVLLHQDHAPAHKSTFTRTATNECGIHLVQHPPYLSEMANSTGPLHMLKTTTLYIYYCLASQE